MRIVHLSDLHFGKHNALLANSLADRIKQLRPDVVVCSGDMADEPLEPGLRESLQYLEQLAGNCTVPSGPRLIVVPGNHDYRVRGYMWKNWTKDYAYVFGGEDSDHFYEKEKVWIFGFDSSKDGAAGGSGRIDDEDLDRFHRRYEELDRQGLLSDALKIVVVHHHPLPVNWDENWKQRWLTMTNAGRFLSAVLLRRVDLVIHGHEHLQAKARLWSTLGGNDHEVTVVSLGTSLRQVSAPDRNWFSLITANADAGVQIEFFGSVGDVFPKTPEHQAFSVRSQVQSRERAFDRWVGESGFFYRAVASVAVIDRDGDARRSVECEDLTITREGCARAKEHPFRLPHTSGYLDKLRVDGDGQAITLAASIRNGSRDQDFVSSVRFQPELAAGATANYAYHWQAVNAFATDQRQFNYQYSRDPAQLDNTEFIQFPVLDPIEQLTVVVRFPDDVVLPQPPMLRVARCSEEADTRKWLADAAIENELKGEHALRYYNTLRIAALRVRRPRQGFSYGIQWKLPSISTRPRDQYTIAVDGLLDIWKGRAPTASEQKELTTMLVKVTLTARQFLMESRKAPWRGPLDASFMYFDGNHTLLTLAAAVDESGNAKTVDYSGVALRYGDGIAGRSFKTNQIRVYVKDDEDSDEPTYYTPLPGVPSHQVLVAFPIQAPDPEGRAWAPYGVLNLGSTRADCPLKLLQTTSDWASKLRAFNGELNTQIYDELTGVFLK